jgi:choice-of-anchor B domain-containing protein
MRHLLFLVMYIGIATTLAAQGAAYNTTTFGTRAYTVGGSGCWGYSDTMIVNGQPRIRELAFMGLVSGVSVVDITSPTLREIGFIPTVGIGFGNRWREIRTSGHYAYITTEADSGGLQIVNLRPDPTNPDSIRFVRTYRLPADNRSHNLGNNAGYAWEANNFIYVCGGNVTQGSPNSGGMIILDVTNKENPVQVGSYGPRYVHDVYVKNDTAYCANVNDNFVDIVNVQNKANPVRMTTFTYPTAGLTHNIWATNDSKYIFTTDERLGGDIRVHDIQNFSNIRRSVASYIDPLATSQTTVHNAYVRGNYLIMSYYGRGVKVVDITEPLDPIEVGAYAAESGATSYNGTWGVFPFYPSGKIIASNINTASSPNGKLFVLNFNNARAGAVYGTVTDGVTGQLISNAQVRALDFYNKQVTSSSNGRYRIRTVEGAAKRFVVSAVGYRSDTVTVSVPTANDSTLRNVMLQASILPVTGLLAVSGTATPTSVRLEWTNPATLGNGQPITTSWKIRIRRDNTFLTEFNAPVPGAALTYTDNGLNEGTRYRYTVSAILASTSDTASAIAFGTPGGSLVPQTISGVTFNTNTSTAVLRIQIPRTTDDGLPLRGLRVLRFRITNQTGTSNDSLLLSPSDTGRVIYYDFSSPSQTSGSSTSTIRITTVATVALVNYESEPTVVENVVAGFIKRMPFSDDLESGVDNFARTDGWDTTRVAARSGSTSLGILNYPNNATRSAFAPFLAISPGPGNLEFWTICRTEANQDFGIVEFSRNTTEPRLWQTLFTLSAASHPEWQAGQNVWKRYSINFPPGGIPIALVRFRLQSNNNTTNGFGWLIDDVAMNNGTLSTVTQPDALPKTFALAQNYPNPFNPTTVINYQVARTVDVKVEVFDILGRRVTTLVNTKQPAGTYSVDFNGSTRASGIYFYKLTAGEFVQTRKMMMVK